MQVRNKHLILAVTILQVTGESVVMWVSWRGDGRARWLWVSRSCPFSHFPAFWRPGQLKQQSNKRFVCTTFKTSWHLYLCEMWRYTFICLWLWLCPSQSSSGSEQFMYTVDCLLVAACLFVLLCILLCHHLWYKNQGEMKHGYTPTLSIITYQSRITFVLFIQERNAAIHLTTFPWITSSFPECCRNKRLSKRKLGGKGNRKVTKAYQLNLEKAILATVLWITNTHTHTTKMFITLI